MLLSALLAALLLSSPLIAASQLAHSSERRYLAACLLARDPVNGDIREWVEYHFSVGVDFVFLFDHSSIVPLWDEVKDYVLEGRVQYTRFSSEIIRPKGGRVFGQGLQGRVFAQCFEQARGYFTWMMFTDHDEFMIVSDPAYDSIPAVLRQYEQTAGAVVAHWLIMGSGGLTNRTAGQGMLATFTKCIARPNEHVKAIVHLDFASVGPTPHSFHYAGGRMGVRPADNRSVSPGQPVLDHPTARPLLLYHYYGAVAEYSSRIPRLRAGISGFTQKSLSQYQTLDARAQDDCLLGARAAARVVRRPRPG